MDFESRMQRASDMGFATDNKLYHGTAGREFKAFDLNKGGAVTGVPTARQGIWTSVDDATPANFFAELAAEKTGRNPRVMPLLGRADNPLVLQLEGYPTPKQLNRAIGEAWKAGHDAVVVRNHFHGMGPTGDTLVVRNPNQLRSSQAAFDPAKRNSSKLLAGIAAGGAGLPLLLNAGDDQNGF
jgi:hypothetical protein